LLPKLTLVDVMAGASELPLLVTGDRPTVALLAAVRLCVSVMVVPLIALIT
jgi:hypothetical protein